LLEKDRVGSGGATPSLSGEQDSLESGLHASVASLSRGLLRLFDTLVRSENVTLPVFLLSNA
jgi:hypothetical protein